MEEMNESPENPFAVTRKIPIASGSSERIKNALHHLAEFEPVLGASRSFGNLLKVTYDSSCIGIRDVERMLDEVGAARDDGISWKIRSAWYAFLDENAKSNARSSGGACCNRPPPKASR